MRTELCKKLGIEYPIFAFTHCRDVVVEVSRAGGLGEAERHEDLHEETTFLGDLAKIRRGLQHLLCIMADLHLELGVELPVRVTPAVVPVEVSDVPRKENMRERDYIILHHLERFLHRLEGDLRTVKNHRHHR